MKVLSRCLLYCGLILSPFCAAFAGQEPSQQDLMKLIQQQAEQIRALQQQMEKLQSSAAPESPPAVLQETVRTEVQTQLQESQDYDNAQFREIWDEIKKVQIHGYVSQGFLWSTDNNFLYSDTESGSFQFNEMALNFSSQLSDDLLLGMQIFSRDLGDIGNNKVQIDWAFADYQINDYFGIRAGKLKIPFGLYNETRDLDMLRTSIILPQSVYSERDRDYSVGLAGAGIYGEIPAGGVGSFEYQTLLGTSDLNDSDGGVNKVLADIGITSDDLDSDVGYVWVGNLVWNTPLDGLRFAGSVRTINEVDWMGTTVASPFTTLLGIPPGIPASIQVEEVLDWMASAEYTWNNLVLAGEYRHMSADISGTFIPAGSFESDGFYINGSYRFTDWFEAGSYYGIYWPDSDDRDGDALVARGEPDWKAWQRDLALVARFDITENWIVKLEGHYMNGAGLLLNQYNSDLDEDWFLFAAKATFTF